jgi:hypothetical protein
MSSFWFIQVLFQCTVAMVVMLALPPLWDLATRSPWRFGFVLLAATLALKLLAAQVRGPDDFYRFSTDAWAYAFALGCIMSQANTDSRRLLTVLTTYLVVGWDHGFAGSHAPFASILVTAVLFVPRVKLWRPAAGAIAFLAQATFFTYLVQGLSINLLKTRLGVESVPLNILAAMALGCASYLAWHMALRLLSEITRRTGLLDSLTHHAAVAGGMLRRT